MRLIMNDEQLQTIEQVKQFLEGSEALEFNGLCAREKYKWTETVLVRFSYLLLKRDEKGVIRRYIQKVTGYSRSQVSRLITEYKRNTEDTGFPGSIPLQKLNYWPGQMNCTGG